MSVAASCQRDTCNKRLHMSHPCISFQREALTVFFWHRIREDFYLEFMDLFEYPQKKNVKNRRIVDVQLDTPSSNGSSTSGTYHYSRWQHILSENKKFRRHCKEALAKWVLSQKAREKAIFLSNKDNMIHTTGEASGEEYDALDDIQREIALRQSYFFPHAGFIHPVVPAASVKGSDTSSAPSKPFNTQLIRDLTLKCDDKHKNNLKLARDITHFIEIDFNLFFRCEMAHKVIESICVGLCRDLAGVTKSRIPELDRDTAICAIRDDVPSLPKKRNRSEKSKEKTNKQTSNISAEKNNNIRRWFEPSIRVVCTKEERTQVQQRIEGDIVVVDIVPVIGTQGVTQDNTEQSMIYSIPIGDCGGSGSLTTSDVISLWLDEYCVDDSLIKAAEVAYGKSTVNNNNGKIFSSWFMCASSRHDHIQHRGNHLPLLLSTGVFGSEIPASVPLPVWDKMKKAYSAYGTELDKKIWHDNQRLERNINDNIGVTPHSANETTLPLSLFRVAVLVIRYESNLSSGSLQLCADGALKDTCAMNGYHVIDLCASPINAYMMPQVETRGSPIDKNGCDNSVIVPKSCGENPSLSGIPNVFCSAFLDTDYYFGSMGSATTLDFNKLLSVTVHDSAEVASLNGTIALKRMLIMSGAINQTHTQQVASGPCVKPLCLTLDVPYDEDLCDLLFCKLSKDVQATDIARNNISLGSHPIVFLLVLPLWWDLNFTHTPKRYIQRSLINSDNSKSEGGNIEGLSSNSISAMQATIKTNASYLEQGHRATYAWLTALPTTPWACFDAVFFKDTYEYFCTVTNRKLNGVTATEVIGLEVPSSALISPRLECILKSFYSVA